MTDKEPKLDLKEVEAFDHEKLKDVEVKEKTLSQVRDLTLVGIEHANRDSLKKIQTVEKNILPSKEDIEKERKESVGQE